MRFMLKSKLHRAQVTSVNKEYEGSIQIDEKLMEIALISPFEQVHIYNITNGNRFITYAIKGPKGSSKISINGAAARLASEGDIIIIATYGIYTEAEVKDFSPTIITMDSNNIPNI